MSKAGIIVSIIGIIVSIISMWVTICYARKTKKISDNVLRKISNVDFVSFVNDLKSLYESLFHKQTVKNNNKGGQCIDIFTKIDKIVVDISKYKDKVEKDDKKKLEDLVFSLRGKVNEERSNPTVDFTDLQNKIYDILIIFNKYVDKSTKNIVN